MSQKRIVVGTDFSDLSLEATWIAAAWGKRLSMPLTLVHGLLAPVGDRGAVPQPRWAGIPNSSRLLEERAREALAELAETTLAGVPHDSVVHESVSAAGLIGEVARECSAHLVVVGTHGKKGLNRIVLGSVAEEVVRCAPCPVLVTRGPLGDYGIPRRILVCTDLAPAAEPALAFAAEIARPFDAEVTLVHVYEPWAQAGAGASKSRVAIADASRNHFGGAALTTLARGANVPAAILDHASRTNVELIVVGTHGRTGVSRVLLGSVAERVARRAACAVLVARPPGLVTRASTTTPSGLEVLNS